MIEVEERKIEIARQDAEEGARAEEERQRQARERGEDPGDSEDPEVRAARSKAFRTFLMGGSRSLSSEELRALSVTPDSSGGYTMAPQEFVAELIKTLDNMVFIRSKATVIPVTNANGLGAPSLDNDPADATGRPSSPPARRTPPCPSASAS
jgi:HK97 family phage major capsid protein